MTKEEILKEYCLSEVKDIPKDLIGWRVLELIPVIEKKKDDKLTLGSFLNKQTICYKTKEERWLGEFRFLLSTTNIGTLVVVDQSCPDYYFIEKEDLLEPVRQLVDIMENPWTLDFVDSIVETAVSTEGWKPQPLVFTTTDTSSAATYPARGSRCAGCG